MQRRQLMTGAMAALLSLSTARARAADASGDVLVFAAASLANVLGDIDRAFTARSGIGVTSSLAASSTLAKQIEAGAPADVYFSADLQWMDYLEERGLLRAGSRRDLVGNSLVLVAPASSSLPGEHRAGLRSVAAARGGHLAVADPDSVPAGIYARQALQKLGVVEQRRCRGWCVPRTSERRSSMSRAVTHRWESFIARTLSWRSGCGRRRVSGRQPSADRISRRAHARSAARRAARYLAFLGSAEARAIFRKWGFEPLDFAVASRRAVRICATMYSVQL